MILDKNRPRFQRHGFLKSTRVGGEGTIRRGITRRLVAPAAADFCLRPKSTLTGVDRQGHRGRPNISARPSVRLVGQLSNPSGALEAVVQGPAGWADKCDGRAPCATNVLSLR